MQNLIKIYAFDLVKAQMFYPGSQAKSTTLTKKALCSPAFIAGPRLSLYQRLKVLNCKTVSQIFDKTYCLEIMSFLICLNNSYVIFNFQTSVRIGTVDLSKNRCKNLLAICFLTMSAKFQEISLARWVHGAIF